MAFSITARGSAASWAPARAAGHPSRQALTAAAVATARTNPRAEEAGAATSTGIVLMTVSVGEEGRRGRVRRGPATARPAHVSGVLADSRAVLGRAGWEKKCGVGGDATAAPRRCGRAGRGGRGGGR